MRNATSQQPSQRPAAQSPPGRQCHPFTIRLISQNPLTVTMTRIVSRAGIKATSCDSPADGSAVLILGQALLTPVTPVAFLQEGAGKSPFCLQRIKGGSKPANSSDAPPALGGAGPRPPCKPHPAFSSRVCEHAPNSRKPAASRRRRLETMALTPPAAARLLLSPPHRHVPFVPSVTLMYEKFKMSLV